MLVEGYPDEQIWQQVELLNSQNLQSRLREVETAAVNLNFSKRDDVCTGEETDAELSASDQDAKKNTIAASTTLSHSIVDDQFFNFEEMEQFADTQEKVNGTSKEELDDYALFEEDDSNMVCQFYRVIRLEEENLAPKPWELVGEVNALVRPENSLLDKSLLFDRATRLPPIITPESTEKLEAMIKRRVKDRVKRKVKPTNDLGVYKSELVLDQQKSKLSLSEVYEQEYLKKREVSLQCPAHEEIRQLLKDLFFKLDALTNFHYTPRPPVPEFAVVSNMPSIVMEEVAPVTVSDATTLAPEEIKRRERREPSAPEENTETDRKRLRRKIKRIQSLRCKKQQLKAGESDKALVPKDKMQILRKVGTVKKTMVNQSAQNIFLF
ncbi:Mpp10 domain containing protein [Trichuris trichiura]|uniref:Mpp10 domain containing protein n=1 Tax=Trichuris trichiura TaxID=36087 RepID=A0A077Z4E1_TRITR|nr:Mpp10 domain containing protein [Trichuris trichiura]